MLILLLIANICLSQSTLSIFDLNKALGRGINMGNMFEAPSEGDWGNPYKEDYFQKNSSLGFNHVRIPILWDVAARASQLSPYTINPTFLARIKSVVDNAIANKLYVVINMHHHEGIFVNPESEKAKFLAQWAQIAEYFKGYDQKLLFEVMNEPHDKLTPALWNVYFNDALQEIRKSNPTRAVVMGVANYGGLSGIPELKIPDDNNLILTIHFYNPFNFTHQGADWVGAESTNWLGTKWEDLDVERNSIKIQFDPLVKLSKEKNIPIHIGEFGAYSKADIESRVKWTTFLARWFEQQNWSWAYWEWSAGFGIYDPATGLMNTKLVDALLKNPMPEAKKLEKVVYYKSDFSAGTDGWNLSVQPGSNANLTVANNLIIDVNTNVKDSWHVQLTKLKLPIFNKLRYQITVKALASSPSVITTYIGKNSEPYNSYSGYSTFNLETVEKEFTYTFVMNDPTDVSARMSFDMGAGISKITISSIRIDLFIEGIITPYVIIPLEGTAPYVIIPLASEREIDKSISIFPNPAKEIVTVFHDKSIKTIDLVENNGKILFSKPNINSAKTILNLSGLASGMYYIYFYSDKLKFVRKIIKN